MEKISKNLFLVQLQGASIWAVEGLLMDAVEWKCLCSTCHIALLLIQDVSGKCLHSYKLGMLKLLLICGEAESLKEDIPNHPGWARLWLYNQLWLRRKLWSLQSPRQSLPSAWLDKFQTLPPNSSHHRWSREADSEAGLLLTNSSSW